MPTCRIRTIRDASATSLSCMFRALSSTLSLLLFLTTTVMPRCCLEDRPASLLPNMTEHVSVVEYARLRDSFRVLPFTVPPIPFGDDLPRVLQGDRTMSMDTSTTSGYTSGTFEGRDLRDTRDTRPLGTSVGSSLGASFSDPLLANAN